MANVPKKKPSVLKRVRQSEKTNLRNKSVRTEVKTLVKKVSAAIDNKDKMNVEGLMKGVEKAIRSATSKGVIKANAASRKISRLAKKAHAVKSGAA